ncbi:MAG: fibronectin type III domain-containing protein, partial [Spirochaetota bacterium]
VTAPAITGYEITSITDTAATIKWTTGSASIAHIELDSGQTFSAAEIISHNSTLGLSFSATITGLSPNTDYSMRISADNDTSKGPAATYDTNTSYNYAFRSAPNTTAGATGNYALSTGAVLRSQLSAIQNDSATSFIIWGDTAGGYCQYLDSSSGTPDTWPKWTAGGETLFASAGTLTTAADGENGIIAVSWGGGASFYAHRVRDNSSAIERVWGGSTTGIEIYSGTPNSAVRAAVTYSGLVSDIASSTNSMSYIYDPATDLSGITSPDIVINENALISATVSSIDAGFPYFMALSSQIISTANGTSYRAADSISLLSGTETSASSGTTIYTTDLFNIGDIITNATSYTYITAQNPPNEYTVAKAPSFAASNALTSYPYLTSGTAATNALYDTAQDFTSPVVLANDIVMNTNATRYGWDYAAATPVYGGAAAANSLLLMSDAGKYLFSTSGDSYRVMRLNDYSTMVEAGVVTSIAGTTITQTGRNFTTDGVLAGDILYNPAATTYKYAKITSVAGDTLTLSSQVCIAGDPFIIFRQALASFVWSEADGNIYMKSVLLDTGTPLFPDATVTGKTAIVTGSSRNPFIVPDTSGNALVVYETTANDISAIKVNSAGTAIWGPSAVTTLSYIKKVVPNGSGGAWVLYTNGSGTSGTSVGIAHIDNTGTVNAYTVAASLAYNPDIAQLDATHAGVVYEFRTAATDVTHIRAAVYTAGSLTGTYNVRSADGARAQMNPHIGADGSGGAHISWIDAKYLPARAYALFVQHIDSTYTRRYADDQCISIPWTPTNTNADDPALLIQAPLCYHNGGTL